jgi:uncharacterized protein with PIN domain
MIAVDTSALVSILLEEPDAGIFKSALLPFDKVLMSAVAHLELGIVMRLRVGEAGTLAAFDLLDDYDIEIVAFDLLQSTMVAWSIPPLRQGYSRESALEFRRLRQLRVGEVAQHSPPVQR